ncbi:MAG TPA: carboxypeptidase-like regulatory domain-containing protein [Caulifigura sp.]|nr:carboxypeptidase-like regulatory domain-containing protein [Caulifigura sp.]
MRRIIGFLTCIALAGCSGGTDGPAIAKVSGVVTLDGAPVEGATVTFQPKAAGPTSFAITNPDGTFTMRTGSGREGAAVGDHMVGVSLSITAGGSAPQGGGSQNDLAPVMQNELQSSGGGAAKVVAPRTVWLVPERYSKAESSGITVTVPSGGLTGHKIELKK